MRVDAPRGAIRSYSVRVLEVSASNEPPLQHRRYLAVIAFLPPLLGVFVREFILVLVASFEACFGLSQRSPADLLRFPGAASNFAVALFSLTFSISNRS